MEDELVGMYVFFVFLGLVAVLTGGYFGYCTGYRNGQVDAINGEIKFELVSQKDGTTAWKEKR